LSIDDLLHAGEDLPAARLEGSPLGVGKRVQRDLEDGERRLELVHACRELRGPVSDRECALVGGAGAGAAGVAQQSGTGGGVLHGSIGGEEGLRFPGGQAVTISRVGEDLLIGSAERQEGERGGEGQPTAVEASGEIRGEAPGQRQAPLHPGPPLAEKLLHGPR
jgi:hypothetical protein